jgi:2-polyprenyl-3-methyl-5-hydroxy-6-metoxy-1,4-benzoquinol methylase
LNDDFVEDLSLMDLSVPHAAPQTYQDKLDPWSSHSIIVDYLKQFPPGTRILDVGTASGTIGRLCKDRAFIMRGIEPVASWAEISRPFYSEIFVSDLAGTQDDFLAGNQVVICADVLEHMADPQSQLSRLSSLQSPGTLFIISLPNVANLWVRLNLLFGKFDYAERGILDQTHLRFFTLSTALQMTAAAGLRVLQVIPTPIPLNLVSPFFGTAFGRSLHALLARLTKAFPSLLGYQFVIFAARI